MPHSAKTEMSRPIPVDRIPRDGSRENIVADPAERELLAARFGIPRVLGLKATIDLARWRGTGVKATGSVEAEIEQVCVVTLEHFVSTMREPVERYFLPGSAASAASATTLEDADVDVFDHGVIDIGELACETAALALDPYPRRPGVAFSGAADSADETEASPFSALGALRNKRE